MSTGKFDEHHSAAFAENVEFLREAGLSDEQVAQRLGVKAKTLEKRVRRKGTKDEQRAG